MGELDVLETVRSVVTTVESLGAKEREQALRWSAELLEVGAPSHGADLMALLYVVMGESIKESNESKLYWITRLAEMNKISEALSNYLKAVIDAARRLEERRRGPDDEPTVAVSVGRLQVERREGDDWVFDPAALIPQDARDGATANLSVGDLLVLASEVENHRETVRAQRQLYASQFENANQKATQYVNMLSSVLKTLNEMARSVIRNLR
jgi:hypothetical protein